MIINQGKGINDLSPAVAMSTINEILSLKDKSEVIKILDDTINMHSDEAVKENARSVKSLLALSYLRKKKSRLNGSFFSLTPIYLTGS